MLNLLFVNLFKILFVKLSLERCRCKRMLLLILIFLYIILLVLKYFRIKNIFKIIRTKLYKSKNADRHYFRRVLYRQGSDDPIKV